MALIACGKCGEQVDEAKAFCPACGGPMVEERERAESSSFDKADRTMQLGQTMYNQLLSDMGLNISKAPDVDKARIIQPVPAAAAPPKQERQDVPAKASNRRIWIITIVAAVALFFAALIAIAAAGVIFYFSGSNTQ